jgi:hypothetical protein
MFKVGVKFLFFNASDKDIVYFKVYVHTSRTSFLKDKLILRKCFWDEKKCITFEPTEYFEADVDFFQRRKV